MANAINGVMTINSVLYFHGTFIHFCNSTVHNSQFNLTNLAKKILKKYVSQSRITELVYFPECGLVILNQLGSLSDLPFCHANFYLKVISV